jgi:hypothetical protein
MLRAVATVNGSGETPAGGRDIVAAKEVPTAWVIA